MNIYYVGWENQGCGLGAVVIANNEKEAILELNLFEHETNPVCKIIGIADSRFKSICIISREYL